MMNTSNTSFPSLKFLDEQVSFFNDVYSPSATDDRDKVLSDNETNNNNNNSTLKLPQSNLINKGANRFTLSQLVGEDDDDDSIDFTLDENALKNMPIYEEDEEEDEASTLDITDGGVNDLNQFNEIYTINLKQPPLEAANSGLNRGENVNNREESKKAIIESSKKSTNSHQKRTKKVDSQEEEDEDTINDDIMSIESIEHDPFADSTDSLFGQSRDSLNNLREEITKTKILGSNVSSLDTLKEEDFADDYETTKLTDRPKSAFRRGDHFRKAIRNGSHQEKNTSGNNYNNSGEQQLAKVHPEIDLIKSKVDKLEQLMESNQVNQGKLESLAKSLEEQQKEMETVKSKLKANNGTNSRSDEIKLDKLSQKLNNLEIKLQEIDNHKGKFLHETSDVDDLKATRIEFVEFRKDNDLTLRAIRKQLTDLKSHCDNLEGKFHTLEDYWNRTNKEFERFSDNHRNDMDKNMRKVEKMVDGERKLMNVIKETQQEVNLNIEKLEKQMKDTIKEIRIDNQSINQDIKTAQNIISDFRNEFGPIISQFKDHHLNSTKLNSIKVDDNKNNDLNVSKRLDSVEKNLQKILVQLEKVKRLDNDQGNYISNDNGKNFSALNDKNQDKKLTESDDSSYKETPSSEIDKVDNHHHFTKFRPKSARSGDIWKRYQFTNHVGSKYDSPSSVRFSPRIQYSFPGERRRMIAPTSTSLLTLIRRTGRLLKNEALDIDFLGNYKFLSDISADVLRKDADSDERAMRKLAQIRFDIDEKLKRLDSLISQRR